MYGTDAAGGPELDFDTAKLILQATIDQLDNDRMTYAQTMKMIKVPPTTHAAYWRSLSFL